MIKIIDLDSLFDKYISDYVYKNVGKVKPEEIENNIPLLYEKFGNEVLPELGTTPNDYYKNFDTESLFEALNTHIEKDVPISDFLCEAITGKADFDLVAKKLLNKDNREQFTVYLLNMIEEVGKDLPFSKLLELVMYDDSETVREIATEILCQNADKVKNSVIESFNDSEEKTKEYLTEILSNVTLKEDRVFDILTLQFVKHQNEIPLYASYLSKYGDDRAIAFLKTAASSEKINYADFEELRFAIEALGGECDENRDFTKDKFYKLIKGSAEKKEN